MRYAPTEAEQAEASALCSPLNEFQTLKSDGIASWGFAGEVDFAYRVAAVFGAGFVPAALLEAQIFPPAAQGSSEILVRNVAAIGLYGAFLSFVVVLAVLGFLLTRWTTVGKGLRGTAFFVEFDPTKKMGYDSGSGGAYSYKQLKSQDEIDRDRLLADFEVDPATSRLRVYFVGALACAAASVAGGGLVDAEMAQVSPEAEEEEAPEEEEDPLSPTFFDPTKTKKKKPCGVGCIPGVTD